MQRKVDARDYRALSDLRRVLSELFNSAGTDWFPDEQMDFHDAMSSVGRILGSLEKETAVRTVARRILAPRAAARQAKGILDRLRKLRPGKGKGKADDDRGRLDDLRHRDMEEAGRRLKDLRLRSRGPGGMTPEQRAEVDRKHPDVPRSIRYTTDWDEVERLVAGGSPGMPERLRNITDWGEVERLLREKGEAA